MRKYEISFLAVMFLLTALPLRSVALQPSYYSFERIMPDMDATTVSCLLQDELGMIWMGSNKGLYSYDGYSTRPHFEYGLSSNSRIYCGLTDSTYLYLGSDAGLLIYNYHTDRYEKPEINSPPDVRALAWYGGDLWMGTLSGLYVYRLALRQVEAVDLVLPHRSIYSLAASDDCLYIGTYDGCTCYRLSSGKAEPITLPLKRKRSNLFVNALLQDSIRQCIWIGMEGSLLKYIPTNGQVENIDGFGDNSVKSLLLDAQGQLLAGTDNGLYIYREETPLLHIVHDSRNPESLSDNIVWSLFADRDQNVWMGTDYGASMARRNAPLRPVTIAQLTGTGEGNQFHALCRDRNGRFWFGGTNGIISFDEEKSDVRWYKMGDSRFPILHNRIRQLYEDRDGILWAATDGGVNRYDANTRRFIPYNIVDSTRHYNANWVYSLFEDEQHRLWIATCLGGIFVVDKQKLIQWKQPTYMAEQTFSTDNGLSGLFVNQMVSDHDGNVWALLYNSPHCIEKITPHNGKVTHIDTEALRDEQPPNVLLCATDGTIWLGYTGGVARITPTDNQVTLLPFNTYNHNEVLAMVEAEGKLWVSTADGLWMVDIQTLEVQRNSISQKRFTSMFYDESTGKIYLGTADEFAITSPELLQIHPTEHPLLLTGLYINNRPYQPEPGQADGSIRYARRIRLHSNQNNLAFDVSDLPYSRDEKSCLTYRLEDSGSEWSQLPLNTNRISFNNMEYGNYRLLVSKLDAYGQISASNVYALDIQILPPWYLTWWAKTVYVLLGFSLIAWGVNFFRVKNHLKQVRVEKEKILEQSKAKMEFLTNFSHDLKTPLSMIIAPISRMLPEVKNRQTRKELEQVQRNALKLNALIHQGLDIDRIDNGTNTMLIWSQVELVSFARGVFGLYAEDVRSKERNLTFRFHANQEKLYVQMDAIKLESMLDNLISNAVKYNHDGGEVSLSVEIGQEEREVSITVSDTGVGIPSSDQPYVFQRFYQVPRTAGKKEGTGIGLYLVKTYTELHGGTVKLTSKEGKGTMVCLSLPVLDTARQRPAISPAAAQEKALPTDAPLVLVVDDDPDSRDLVCRMVGTTCRCLTAVNGKEALEEAMRTQPDLIISDVMMPVMDGFELARRLKKHVPTSNIPIILLTGKDDKETELESIRLHTDAFISKPFEPELLLSRIEQLLYRRRQQEAQMRMEALASPKEIEATSLDEKFLANVTRLIEEHITDSDLNVNALCKWAAVTNKQMYRKIKQMTGQTPVEYIKSIRMKKAAMLLKQQRFTVAEVMYMVGFSSHSYFSKCFQSAFGVTPKEYSETAGE